MSASPVPTPPCESIAPPSQVIGVLPQRRPSKTVELFTGRFRQTVWMVMQELMGAVGTERIGAATNERTEARTPELPELYPEATTRRIRNCVLRWSRWRSSSRPGSQPTSALSSSFPCQRQEGQFSITVVPSMVDGGDELPGRAPEKTTIGSTGTSRADPCVLWRCPARR
jgi:hypothetical protein